MLLFQHRLFTAIFSDLVDECPERAVQMDAVRHRACLPDGNLAHLLFQVGDRPFQLHAHLVMESQRCHQFATAGASQAVWRARRDGKVRTRDLGRRRRKIFGRRRRHFWRLECGFEQSLRRSDCGFGLVRRRQFSRGRGFRSELRCCSHHF